MFGLSLKEKITKATEDATDEEVIDIIMPLLKERLKTGVGFIENEDGLIVGYKGYLVVGELMIPAEATMFDWPYQAMPIPEAMKGMLH